MNLVVSGSKLAPSQGILVMSERQGPGTVFQVCAEHNHQTPRVPRIWGGAEALPITQDSGPGKEVGRKKGVTSILVTPPQKGIQLFQQLEKLCKNNSAGERRRVLRGRRGTGLACPPKPGALPACVSRGERGGPGSPASHRRLPHRSLRGDALFSLGTEIDRGLLLDGRGKEAGPEESEGRPEESERGPEGPLVGSSRAQPGLGGRSGASAPTRGCLRGRASSGGLAWSLCRGAARAILAVSCPRRGPPALGPPRDLLSSRRCEERPSSIRLRPVLAERV